MKVKRWWLSNDYDPLIINWWGVSDERWVTMIAMSNYYLLMVNK